MPYTILSLDGGGAWALIQVKALIQIFGGGTEGHVVLRNFDLVAANSGGSIVLGGLMENVTLDTLLGYFMDQGNRQKIFSPTSSWGDKALELALHLGPKYSASAKLPALEGLMPKTGNTRILGITKDLNGPGGAPVRMMIVGFDYDRNRATFFRSVAPAAVSLGVACPADITMAEAIHASSNAPVNYFDAPAVFPARPERYWDGGVTGFNNPVLAAVTEAMANGVAASDIAALSIGTATVHLPNGAKGDAPSPFVLEWQDSSLLNDVRKMASSILDDPPDAASCIAHLVTFVGGPLPPGANSRIVRMNPLITPAMDATGQWMPPGGMTPAQFQYLYKVDMDAVLPAEVDAVAAYADLWMRGVVPNQLIHTDGSLPPVGFGHATFPDAMAGWRALVGQAPWPAKPA